MQGGWDTEQVILRKKHGSVNKSAINREIAKGNVEITKKGNSLTFIRYTLTFYR